MQEFVVDLSTVELSREISVEDGFSVALADAVLKPERRLLPRLYAGAGCHHTARVRSYLRTNSIDVVEVRSANREFQEELLPQLQRWTVPVLKTAEGRILEDGTGIIEAFHQAGASRYAIYPRDPNTLILASVIELFGIQGLLRPALYYRWFFEEVNSPFLEDMLLDYGPIQDRPQSEKTALQRAFSNMRKVASDYGVVRESFRAIEDSFAQFLLLLDNHFARFPFILGGHPTIADYGLGSTVLAYFVNDPAPLRLIQTHCVNLYRWAERMNSNVQLSNDRISSEGAYLFSPDDLPGSLHAILAFIGRDFLPEIRAQIDWTNRHFDTPYPPVYDPKEKTPYFQQGIGQAVFEWRHIELSSEVLPLHLGFIQKLHDVIDMCGDDTSTEMLRAIGLEGLTDVRLSQSARKGLGSIT